jgi:hypothetical protein
MRNGFKVIDSDTHFQPAAESILPYLRGTAIESRIPEFEQSMVPIRTGRAGQKLSEPFRHWFRFGRGGGGGGWAGDGPRILAPLARRVRSASSRPLWAAATRRSAPKTT